VAGDVALSMSDNRDGSPVAGVNMLSMLQVGPRVATMSIVGGAECGCAGSGNVDCAEEITGANQCSGSRASCESPTANEACTVLKQDHATSRACNNSNCVSEPVQESIDCETEENCGGGGG